MTNVFFKNWDAPDETDTPHVALTIELGGLLWTGDKKLKEGLQRKGFVQLFELNNK